MMVGTKNFTRRQAVSSAVLEHFGCSRRRQDDFAGCDDDVHRDVVRVHRDFLDELLLEANGLRVRWRGGGRAEAPRGGALTTSHGKGVIAASYRGAIRLKKVSAGQRFDARAAGAVSGLDSSP